MGFAFRVRKKIVRIITSEEAQYFITLTCSNPEAYVK